MVIKERKGICCYSEKNVFDKWLEEKKSLNNLFEYRDESPPFVFYEGPPTANGLTACWACT